MGAYVMVKTLVLAALLAGCSTGYHPMDSVPLGIVWTDTYHASACIPPDVILLEGQTCGGHAGTFEYNGGCVYGVTDVNMWRSLVAWDGSYSQSAFSHELLHGWQWCRGLYDPKHELAEWGVLVPAAIRNLEDAGL